jgi:hypothetical protein
MKPTRRDWLARILLAGALLAPGVLWPAAAWAADPPGIEVKEIRNLAGESRWVAAPKPGAIGASRYVKLYMSEDALRADNPTKDFIHPDNSFHMSCGPDAAINLFRWHGISRLDRTLARLKDADVPHQLGKEMGTNKWRITPRPRTAAAATLLHPALPLA